MFKIDVPLSKFDGRLFHSRDSAAAKMSAYRCWCRHR